MDIKLFEEGENYFINEQWKDAFDVFQKIFIENKNIQYIYPYLAYSALKIKQFELVNYFLEYPFDNKLITSINSYDRILTKEKWQEIEFELNKNNIKYSNIVKLNFLYFKCSLEEKLNSLLSFVPNNQSSEFWLNIFVYNSYQSYYAYWRYNIGDIPIYKVSSFQEIREYCNKCISIYNNYSLPYYLQASFSSALPNGWIQLFDPLNKAIELNPNYFEAYILRQSWYYDEEMYQECISDNQKALSLAVTKKLQSDIYYRLGDCFSNISKYFDAIISYNRAIDLGSNENVYFDRGLAKLNFKDYSGALNDFNEAINFEDVSILILKFRAEAKLNLKDFYGAIGDLTIFLEDEPHDYEAYSLRSNCYKAIDEIELSDNDLKKAQELKAKYSYGDSEDFEDED